MIEMNNRWNEITDQNIFTIQRGYPDGLDVIITIKKIMMTLFKTITSF